MNPTQSDLHIDTYLSNLSIAFMNQPSDYIADQVFPVVLTNKQSDKYAIYNKYDWFRDEAQQRAILTESTGGGYQLTTPGTFYCDEYAFHKAIADEDIDNADEVFDLEEEAVEYVVEKLKIKRERLWASAYFQTGVWTTDLEGKTVTPGTNEFTCWDETGGTPIEDIEDAKAVIKGLTGLMPNTLVVSMRVHQALKNHSDVIDRYKYTQAGIITPQLLAKVFEVDRYLVGSALYSSTPEGTNDLSFILDENDALLVYSAPRPTKRRPSGGYTFRWKKPIQRGRSAEKLESTIRRWYENKIKGTVIEGSVYEDIKLVAADCGVFFHNAIALGTTIS